jgi:hypothetical protein
MIELDAVLSLLGLLLLEPFNLMIEWSMGAVLGNDFLLRCGLIPHAGISWTLDDRFSNSIAWS